MSKLNFYLIRHGKTQMANALNGSTDVLVDDDIQDEMAACIQAGPVKQIVSSPLRRCFDVADRLNPEQFEIRVEANWRELDFGRYDGIPYDELGDAWAELEAFWADPLAHPLPESEPLDQGYYRAVAAWKHLVEQAQQDTIVITHGGMIRFVLAHLLNVDWKDPKWYSVLNITNQSVTHVQLLRYEGKAFFSVQGVGIPLTTTTFD